MDIPTDMSSSISDADIFCVDRSLVKMEPHDEYDEASVIVIKEEINSDYENETNDDGEYYSYIDMSSLEEANESFISGTENSCEESLQNSDTRYVMICKDIEDNAGKLHLHLLNEKPFVKSFERVAKVVDDNRQTKFKTKAHIKKSTMMTVAQEVDRPFQCSECDEKFELKSHLVMHELGHETYRKYTTIRHSLTPQEPILHTCKDCGASFEHKSLLLAHRVYHENDDNSNCSCRKSLRTTSDLCRCFVRECQSCHRSYFAAIKLGNWSACIKCFFLNDSSVKHVERSKESEKCHNYSMYENAQRINIKEGSTENLRVTNVKKLCCSCGKMSSNVVSAGSSWLCYSCWNHKMNVKRIKRIKESYPQIQTKYKKTDCVYCLELFPIKSRQRGHQCLHKSIYLEDTQIGNNDYVEVKLPEKFGHHFLLPPMDNSFESSKHINRTVMKTKPLSDLSLNAVPSKLSNVSQNYSWNTYNDDDDDDCVGGDDSDCEEHQTTQETVEAEIMQDDDDSSTRTVILCDKTGELIDLSSEVAQPEQK